MTTKELREVLIVESYLKKWIRPDDTWSWNEYGSVDVKGSVSVKDDFQVLPFKFGTVSRDFWCSVNKLETFKNFPDEVGNDLMCTKNFFKNLDYLPKKIGGSFLIFENSVKFSKKEIMSKCNINKERLMV